MIADMAQVLILGRKRDSLEVARALQNAGVVHIDPLEAGELPRAVLQGADAERKSILERQLARAESALAALGVSDAVADENKLKTIPDLGAFLEEVGHRTDVLSKEHADLTAELGAIGSFSTVTRSLADLSSSLSKSERVGLLGFTFVKPEELMKLEQTLKDAGLNYALGNKTAANLEAGVLVVRKQDLSLARTALTRSGLGEVRLPGRFENLGFSSASELMLERARTAPEELQGVNDGLERLKREHAGTLSASRLELRDELGRFDAINASLAGKYGFAMRGWLPKKNTYSLEMALAPLKGQVIYQFEDAPTHHAEHVPVTLDNNSAVKPFELLMGIFAPPAYGSFDPTWVIALCFPIFFGFVIGDIGLGAISLALAFMFRGMADKGQTLKIDFMGVAVSGAPLKNVATVLTHMAVWSIIFGFVYGEFFGTLGEHLGLFYIAGHAAEGAGEAVHEAKGLIPILIPRLESTATGLMLILSLIPGILQILYGWFIRFRLGLQHHDKKHTYEGIGMFVGLVGLILISYSFRNPGTPPIFNIIAAVCGLVFVACVFLSGVFMMFIEIISNGGNILSYLRLYAVGLSSAVLGKLATDAGWSLGMGIGGGKGLALGVLGVIGGIVVATLIHFLAILFTIIGHVLQPLRLHYAEFFTKFGFYDGSGRQYKPFARLSQAPSNK